MTLKNTEFNGESPNKSHYPNSVKFKTNEHEAEPEGQSELSKIFVGNAFINNGNSLNKIKDSQDSTSDWHQAGAQYGFVDLEPFFSYCFTKGAAVFADNKLDFNFPLHCSGTGKTGNTSQTNRFDYGVKIGNNNGESLLLEPLPFLNVRLK